MLSLLRCDSVVAITVVYGSESHLAITHGLFVNFLHSDLICATAVLMNEGCKLDRHAGSVVARSSYF